MKKLLVTIVVIIPLLAGCTPSKQDTELATLITETVENTEENKSNEDELIEQGEPLSAVSEAESIFAIFPNSFSFQSGAGAWSTDLHIEEDGIFSGLYHDSDMGDSGDNFPNGTVYICNFSGKFSEPEQINEYTYSMKLESINIEGNLGAEYYEDDIRYVYSEPYGLENADEIIIYLPGAKLASLPEKFLSWTELAYAETLPEALPFYGLYNVSDEEGFVGYLE